MKLFLKSILTYFLPFLILMVVIPFSSHGQEVEIRDGRFELNNTSKYKMKKVKKVEVLSAWDSTLCWMIELDTSGKILKQGKFHYGYPNRNNPYFIVEESFDSGNVTLVREKHNFQNGQLIRIEPASYSGKMNHKLVNHYFQNQKLIRVDTTVSERVSFHYTDTTTNFTRTISKVYKRGDLINQQNNRLNELYLNQPIGEPTTSWGRDTNGNVVITRIESEVYFKTKLKDDYDSTKIYLCSIETSDNGFWAIYQSPLMKSYKEIAFRKLKNNRVIANYKEEPTKDCRVEGECFEEPKSKSSGRYYIDYGRRDQDADLKYKYSTNKKGLHKDIYCLDCYNFYIDKRYKKGKKTKIYTFNYTYFE